MVALMAWSFGWASGAWAGDDPHRDQGGFKVARADGAWWFIGPSGQRFFSVGVCVLSQGASREAYDPENPAYAAWRQHVAPSAWADVELRRLSSWGFTTLGGWADLPPLRASPAQTLCITPVLHIGAAAGAPWWDMWDEANLRRMEETARAQIGPLRDDPRVVGYFSDNELGWWNATLWKMTLEQPSGSGQRHRLVALLRETYDGDWKKLLADFEPENATGWSQLRRGGMLFLRPGGDGVRVMRRFLGMVADRYYEIMRGLIRKNDPDALFLGDRYQSFFYPEVARASARHVDVASSNLNAHWDDGSFLRCFPETLHVLTGKPVIVSEFYAAARDNRSGNRNSHGTYPVAPTQAARAEVARTTLGSLARLPFVVGADWFQFSDEPTHGREDGENFNFGLVDIHDRPYEELVEVFRSLDAGRRHSVASSPRPDASQGIPPAPPDPLADFLPPRAMRAWDRERGFVKPSGEAPLADLYVCWSPRGLFVGLYSLDIVEPAYYRGTSVPKADRALWTLRVDGREIVRARIGAGREPVWSEPKARVENASGVGSNVSNVAGMEIPAALLGQDELRPGDTIEIDCTLLTHGRAYRVDWKGRFILAR